MLNELQIKNVAIIDSVDIEFGKGFNVLTGETGAGKSILIDSINMALGGRTSRDLVRSGSDYAYAQAVFDVSPKIREKLEELDIEAEDDTLIISRKITSEGKSTCKINGITAPLAVVREISELLLTIHGQQDNRSLLKSSAHREFVDDYAKNAGILSDYRAKYEVYTNLCAQYDALNNAEFDKERRLELLRYSSDEIDKSKLKTGEEEELEQRREFLTNIESIMSNVGEAYSSLYGDEMTKSAYDLIENASRCLESASEYDENLSGYYETISSALADIDDVTRELKSYLDSVDYEAGELDMVEGRLVLISDLKRKYNCTSIHELVEYSEKCKAEIESIENLDSNLIELKQKIDNAKSEMVSSAKNLTESRVNAGKSLSEAIMRELSELDMSKVVFSVNIKECEYGKSGCDDIEFLISTNPGEALKPLSKIASGGEMSRIMLAIKSILSENDIVDTMIFDEIDTGVSGRAAQKISEKICKISRSKQVLCITHLAQIASMADRQYLIEKNSSDEHTSTNVRLLTKEERKSELSRIIGGVSVTETTLKAANEMLEQAESLKAKA